MELAVPVLPELDNGRLVDASGRLAGLFLLLEEGHGDLQRELPDYASKGVFGSSVDRVQMTGVGQSNREH